MSYLKIAQAVAGGLGLPLSKLTRKAIEKSKIPSRFKKFMTRERTTGELSQGPKNLIKGSVGVADKEVKAFGRGIIGGLITGEAVDLILEAAKAASKGTEKTKSKGPKKRDDKAMKKSLDNKAAVKRKTSILNPTAKKFKTDQQIKRGVKKALKEANTNKPKNKPKKRPANMNKGGMVNDMRKSGLFR